MANMSGFMGHTTARIQSKGTGYDNKSLHKFKAVPKIPNRVVAPPSYSSLRNHTMNKVVNYRLGNNPLITQDTQLASMI